MSILLVIHHSFFLTVVVSPPVKQDERFVHWLLESPFFIDIKQYKIYKEKLLADGSRLLQTRGLTL